MTFKERIIRYEELKVKEKEIKVELDDLKELIIPEMESGQVIDMAQGKLSIRGKSTWTYSDMTEQMAKDLKERQAEEKATGEAEAVVTESLTYTANK